MDKKQLFDDWAPREGYVWTKFAKPALFVHADSVSGRQVYEAEIPWDIRKFRGGGTAIIVDLPGVSSVETGLGLAQSGFRPVPLYNGIHEAKNGGLRDAVDNTAIINALKTGVNALRYIDMHTNAPPVFLLDANRDTPILDTEDVYDNRWNVDLDDMPDAAYMRAQRISKVIVWTDRGIQDDLRPILDSYREAGIHVGTYMNGRTTYEEITPSRADGSRFSYIKDSVSGRETSGKHEAIIEFETKEAVRKFENARFGLLLVVIMAAINLVGMFFVNEEPLLWTAPSIMWLTYLWVIEIVGDVLAVTMTLVYVVLYLLSHKKRHLMLIALFVFGFDVLVFYVYAFYYGILAFTGYSLGYGLVVFTLPLVLLGLLISGAVAYQKVAKMDEGEYIKSLDHIDHPDGDHDGAHFRGRRGRIFRVYRGANYRGYGGYGGTGRGGYGGSGGYSGGYGGFGG